MGVGRSPENLLAWQLCEELADLVMAITAEGPSSRDFPFCDQIRRASGGPAPNIAEGFGRFTPREFAHYLRIAISSLMETRTFLLRGRRRSYWPPDTCAAALALCERALEVTRRLLAAKVKQLPSPKRSRPATR